MKNRSMSDKAALWLSYAVLTVSFLLVLLPLMNLISVSLSTETEVLAGHVTFWPRGPHLNAFEYILSSKRFYTAFSNTVILTVLGTAVSMISTCLAAYALSRRQLPGRRLIMV